MSRLRVVGRRGGADLGFSFGGANDYLRARISRARKPKSLTAWVQGPLNGPGSARVKKNIVMLCRVIWAKCYSHMKLPASLRAPYGLKSSKPVRTHAACRAGPHCFIKNTKIAPVREPYSPWLKIQLAQLLDTGFLRYFARRRHVDVRERPARGPYMERIDTVWARIRAHRSVGWT